MNTKFKAWVNEIDKMFDVSILDLRHKHPLIQLHGVDNKTFTIHEVDVIQYTGLNDLNGKEIWEGDIVEVHLPDETPVGHLSVVTISKRKGPVVSRHPIHIKRNPQGGSERQLADFINIDEEDNKICRVIGNVYENPEFDVILLIEKQYNALQYSEQDMNIN